MFIKLPSISQYLGQYFSGNCSGVLAMYIGVIITNCTHAVGTSDICFSYIKKDFTHASNSVCVFSIVSEVLSALGLVILILLSIVKLASGLME